MKYLLLIALNNAQSSSISSCRLFFMTIYGNVVKYSVALCIPVIWSSLAHADINPASGNYSNAVVDYQHFSEPELAVERIYNSVNRSVTANSALGNGWSLSYLSENLVVHRHYTRFTETFGPYWRYVQPNNTLTPYYQSRSYAWSGRAMLHTSTGQRLSLISNSDAGWVVVDKNKMSVTCLNPILFNGDVPANTTMSGLYSTIGSYRECSSFSVKWDDGKEKVYGLKLGNVYKLTSVKNRGGWRADLEYDASGKLQTVTTITGKTLAFEYDAGGMLQKLVAPGNYVVNYYHSGNLLNSVGSPEGRGANYEYNSPYGHALLTDIKDAAHSSVFKVNYDSSQRATTTENANSQVVSSVVYVGEDASGTIRAKVIGQSGVESNLSFIYSGGYRPISETDLDGYSTIYEYDENGRYAGFTDKNGNSTSHAITPSGNQVDTYYPNGLVTTKNINVTLNEPTKISTPVATTYFKYDSRGNVIKKRIVADGITRAWTYTYDNLSRVTSVTDPIKGKTSFTYVDNELSAITNSLNQTWLINQTNAHGLPLSITNPAGLVTTFHYDDANRLVRRQIGSAVTHYAYTSRDTLERLTLPDSTYIEYEYDESDKLMRITRSDGAVLEYERDLTGKLIKLTVLNNGVVETATSFGYSSVNGKVSVVTDGMNSSTHFSYDPVGNLRSILDALNRTTHFQYDDENNLVLRSRSNSETSIAYDYLGNLFEVSSPNYNATSYTYNGFGQVIDVQSPDSGNTQYAYLKKGLLSTKTDAKGNVATYKYDALGRTKKVAYAGGDTYTFVYDTVRVGELTSIAGGGAKINYTYDNMGRVNTATQTVGAVTKTTNYSWDDAGKLISQTTPSGYEIRFSYESGASKPNSIQVNGNTLISSVSWSASHQIPLQWVWSNGVVRDVLLDANGQIEKVVSGGGLFRQLSRDAVNNVLSIESELGAAQNQYFSYDQEDRLLTETLLTGQQKQYFYDPDGNRLQMNEGAKETYYYYDPYRLIGIDTDTTSEVLSVDENGSLILDNKRIFTYNPAGRLKTVKKGSKTTSYRYNGLGQRYKKNGMLFVYDLHGRLLGEYTTAGVLIQEYVWLNNVPVAVLRANGSDLDIYYIHSDELNTPRVVTDSNNQIVWEWKSDAFGNGAANEDPSDRGSSFVMNLRFPGQYYDKESGLHYNYFRDYDPSVGRYIQSDPIGLAGGINTYAYVGGNPLMYVDPFGLSPEDIQRIIATGQSVIDYLTNAGLRIHPSVNNARRNLETILNGDGEMVPMDPNKTGHHLQCYEQSEFVVEALDKLRPALDDRWIMKTIHNYTNVLGLQMGHTWVEAHGLDDGVIVKIDSFYNEIKTKGRNH